MTSTGPGQVTPWNGSFQRTPRAASGWNDPFHGVTWPGPVEVIAARDRDYPDIALPQLHELRGLYRP